MLKKINLFPSTIGLYKIQDDITPLYEFLKVVEYSNLNTDYPNICSSSVDITILNKFQDIKLSLLSYFNDFKDNVLAYHHTNFSITTSWSSKCEYNQCSQFHSHKNSFYSGVLYFEDSNNGGNIEFNDNVRPCSFFVTPQQPTIETSDGYFIKPMKNLLVFFPSYLRHRISLHKEKNPRISLAFNIVPIGQYGTGDSSTFTTINI